MTNRSIKIMYNRVIVMMRREELMQRSSDEAHLYVICNRACMDQGEDFDASLMFLDSAEHILINRTLA